MCFLGSASTESIPAPPAYQPQEDMNAANNAATQLRQKRAGALNKASTTLGGMNQTAALSAPKSLLGQ